MSEYNYGPLEHELAGGTFAEQGRRDYYAEYRQSKIAKYSTQVLVDLLAAGEINHEQYERLRRESVEQE